MQVSSFLPKIVMAMGLVGHAAADTFMVFSTKTTGQPRREAQSFQFFGGPDVAWVDGNPTPDCFKAIHTMWWDALDDVSGDKHGVRVVGDDTDPDVLEWNTPDEGHYTVYKDRDFGIYATSGELVGSCVPDNHYQYNCDMGSDVNADGTQVFWCNSDSIHF